MKNEMLQKWLIKVYAFCRMNSLAVYTFLTTVLSCSAILNQFGMYDTPKIPLIFLVIFTIIFSVLTFYFSKGQNFDQRYAKILCLSFDSIRPLIYARIQSWFFIARRVRGVNKSLHLSKAIANCNELKIEQQAASILSILCNQELYQHRIDEVGSTVLHASFWRPIPLSVVESKDNVNITTIKSELASKILNMKDSDDSSGIYSWTEKDGKKYVLASRCYCSKGRKNLRGAGDNRHYLNELAASASVFQQIINEPIDSKKAFYPACYEHITTEINNYEARFGHRLTTYGLSYAVTSSLLLIRINRHFGKPNKSIRRDILGVVSIHAENELFFTPETVEATMKNIEPTLELFHLFVAASDSMGVLQRKAETLYNKEKKINEDIKLPRFGQVMMHFGAEYSSLQAALSMQKINRKKQLPPCGKVGELYVEFEKGSQEALTVQRKTEDFFASKKTNVLKLSK